MNNPKIIKYFIIIILFISGFLVAKSFYQPKERNTTEAPSFRIGINLLKVK